MKASKKMTSVSVRTTVEEVAETNPVSAPVQIHNVVADTIHHIKVDLVCRTETKIFVAGWVTGAAVLGLAADKQDLPTVRLALRRPDVAAHFGLQDDRLGFILVADYSADRKIALTWRFEGGDAHVAAPFSSIMDLPPDGTPERQLLAPALPIAAVAVVPFSAEWKYLSAGMPITQIKPGIARAYIEATAVCGRTGQAVVVGWSVSAPNVPVWLEDEQGNIYELNKAHRRFRQDVHDAVSHEFGHNTGDAGFVARIEGVRPGARIAIKAMTAAGIHHLGATDSTVLPSDPVAAARWLFSLNTPISELHKRIPVVDAPILEKLIQERVAAIGDLPVKVKRLGSAAIKPKVSIIVPLYGRFDFVEHQLMEFARDPWLMANAEVIYVIDDPTLVEPFTSQAELLFRVYKVPFTWVWGSVNRGYSSANNLGAKYAVGEHMLFLNSDAFPQSPGWLKPLCDHLDTQPGVGAVGPRLLFADGSIQHAGMAFMRREELGIWINHHPNMGLDPSLDPVRAPATVSCVTGACVLVRAKDYAAIGGWDSGYLIGDFEDSDLCLKLTAAGFRIEYMPNVQLTHLERQSFKLLGHDDFRNRVVIYNAVRHQNRWPQYLPTSN